MEKIEKIRPLLCELQSHLRDHLLRARGNAFAPAFSAYAKTTEADILYAIDSVSETLIFEWVGQNWPREESFELVMEGVDPGWIFPESVKEPRWKLIMDPIDGTRNLMFDKRAGWVLSGIAPNFGPATCLADLQIGAMTELPPSASWRSVQVSCIAGEIPTAIQRDVRTGTESAFQLQPSASTDCRHGFATFARYFPLGLEISGRIEEKFWQRIVPESGEGIPLVFNDQYISSGGQLFEMMAGHDRFVADLRPLIHAKLGKGAALAAHPYDLACLPAVTASGVRVEDPLTGGLLRAPLDCTTPVAWVAYANPQLRDLLAPVLREVLEEEGLTGSACI